MPSTGQIDWAFCAPSLNVVCKWRLFDDAKQGKYLPASTVLWQCYISILMWLRTLSKEELQSGIFARKGTMNEWSPIAAFKNQLTDCCVKLEQYLT